MLSQNLTELEEEINRGHVETTAPGGTTNNSVFNTLFSLVDVSKVTKDAKLSIKGSGYENVYTVTSIQSTQIVFMMSIGGSNGNNCDTITISASSSWWRTFTDTSSSKVQISNIGGNTMTSGTIVSLYY